MTFTMTVLAVLLLASAVGVVASKSPIVSALCLVGNLVTVAGFYAALEAHFLAAVQVLVYAGAIVVLVLFVLMLLNAKDETQRASDAGLKVAGSVVATLFFLLLFPILVQGILPGGEPILVGTVRDIGKIVYTEYVYCFEVASVLILVAVVGAVTIGKRAKPSVLSDRTGA